MTAAAQRAATISDVAHVPARWSWISHFASSPLHARHAALHGKEPTAAMKLGTAGHVVTFEQPFEVFREENPKTGEVWNRNSKAWKEFKADREARDIAPLSVKEYDHGCRLRDALRDHSDAAALLFGEGVVREQPIAWTRHGRACSSRPDARKPGDWIADLKTCRTAKPERFAAAARWSGYPGQLRFYEEADAFERGRDLGSLRRPDLFIVAIEPFAPYAITVFEFDVTAREFGARSVSACWESLAGAEASNEWPSYSQSIVPFVIESDDAGPDPDDFDNDNAVDPEDDEEEL